MAVVDTDNKTIQAHSFVVYNVAADEARLCNNMKNMQYEIASSPMYRLKFPLVGFFKDRHLDCCS